MPRPQICKRNMALNDNFFEQALMAPHTAKLSAQVQSAIVGLGVAVATSTRSQVHKDRFVQEVSTCQRLEQSDVFAELLGQSVQAVVVQASRSNALPVASNPVPSSGHQAS